MRAHGNNFMRSHQGDAGSPNNRTKDQSAPIAGVIYIDAGGLGAGSYDI
jgi:kynureninase